MRISDSSSSSSFARWQQINLALVIMYARGNRASQSSTAADVELGISKHTHSDKNNQLPVRRVRLSSLQSIFPFLSLLFLPIYECNFFPHAIASSYCIDLQ